MSLTVGIHIGPYEITGTLGAGGMGEVYRARDPRLGRDVALKVLPDLFAGDPERLARFQREAQVLASLKHPNIGAIYGLDAAQYVAPADVRHYAVSRDGRRFLMMAIGTQDNAPASQLIVVQNWHEDLKRRVPIP